MPEVRAIITLHAQTIAIGCSSARAEVVDLLLAMLEREGLIARQPEAAGAEPIHAFTDPLTREVAYNLLLFA